MLKRGFSKPALLSGFARPKAFLRRDISGNDDGGMLYLGLVLLVLMLMIGGIAVDMMRYEMSRTRLQQTADRAVLAAASMSQTLPTEVVVQDYFDKNDLGEYLKGSTLSQGLNFKTVTAESEMVVPSFFMQLLGVKELEAKGDSGATERITNVEISLVLDVSGSMTTNDKIGKLRTAASEFVDLVISGSDAGRVSVSLVPYSGQVNIGPVLASKFNLNGANTHTYSYCVELPSDTFEDTNLSRTTPLVQSAHFDPFYYTSNGYSSGDPSPVLPFCEDSSYAYVRPLQGDVGVLQGYINNLEANGNTAIDIGVKWGALLLDPAVQPMIAELASENVVSENLANRPVQFGKPEDTETLKVIVVMTDGENTTQYQIAPNYRNGQSNIYRDPASGRLTARHEWRTWSSKRYYWPDEGTWYSYPKGGSNAVRLNWDEVWSYATVSYVAWDLYARPYTSGYGGSVNNRYKQWRNEFLDGVNYDVKDERLQMICDEARSKDVVIYGIAFEASDRGENSIRNCADPGNYYDVEGTQISTAFRTIASQISQLRLTQ